MLNHEEFRVYSLPQQSQTQPIISRHHAKHYRLKKSYMMLVSIPKKLTVKREGGFQQLTLL